MKQISNRDRMIVALDMSSAGAARDLVDQLGPSASFYKVGLELIYAGGLPLIEELIEAGNKIFLDAKLLDIDNTVAGAITSIMRTGATFVTLHAYPKAMRAAVAVRGDNPLKLLGVSVLTSMDDADTADAGYGLPVRDLVLRRASDAKQAMMDGIVASPAEAAAIRAAVGPGMLIVTPGIRPRGSDAGDQKRIATPAEAITAGADYLVVGRAITAAPDPVLAADAIVAEIGSALSRRGSPST
jgi:orotidine-5'-phosphate decarboxylase